MLEPARQRALDEVTTEGFLVQARCNWVTPRAFGDATCMLTWPSIEAWLLEDSSFCCKGSLNMVDIAQVIAMLYASVWQAVVKFGR